MASPIARRCGAFGVLVCSATMLLVSATPLVAQQASATLEGRVLDQQGGVLPGAAIVARDQDTGMFRETVSAADGSYRFTALNPGVYRLDAQLSGFGNFTLANVRLEVGKSAELNIVMQVAGLAEQVTVNAEAPIVDMSSAQVGGALGSRELVGLPSLNRNFTAYLALLPGAVASYNPNSFGADSVAASGQPAGNVSYNLDGGSNNDSARGGGSGAQVRMAIEAIQEFQFLTGQFDAEFGSTSGAIVNAISKQGSNAFRGSAFLFVKDASLTARDYFAKKLHLAKPDTREQQWGGTLGGPILRNKAFFFASFERVIQDQGVTVNIPVRPDLNSTEIWQSRATNFFGRVDHQINATETWGVRYLRELSPQKNRLTATNITPSRATGEADVDQMAVGTLNSVFGNRTVNTLRVSWTSENVLSAATGVIDNDRHPELLDPSLVMRTYSMGVSNLAQGWHDQNVRLDESLAFYLPSRWGAHDLKAGLQYNYVWNDFYQGGSANGVFTFQTDLPFDAANPSTYPERLQIRVPGVSDILIKGHNIAAYIQDKWRPQPRLTLSVGLRYELDVIPVRYPDNPLFANANRYPIDKNNFGPRLGVNYAVEEDGRASLRAGWGILYNATRVGDVDPYLESGVLSDSFIVSFPANNADPGPSRGQRPTDPMLVNGPVINRTLLNALYPPGVHAKNTGVIQLDNPDRRTPYTRQFSIGYSKQLWQTSAVTVDYLHSASFDQLLDKDLNPGVRVNTSRTGQVQRVDPTYTNSVFLVTNLGRARYDSLQVQLEKRPSHGVSYRVSYTLAKSKSLFTDQVLDNLNLQWAPSTVDRRHILNISGSFDVPHTGGLRVSAVARKYSGTPFTIQDTNSDSNRNGILLEPLPAGSYSGTGADALTVENRGGINGATGPGLFLLDSRVGYVIKLRQERTLNVYAEVLNVTNHTNFATPSGDRRLSTFLVPGGIFGGTPPRTLQLGMRLGF